MKLLFDQNLSHRFVDKLKPHFPDSTHVRQVGLAAAFDQKVRAYVRDNEFCNVSKDMDFEQRVLVYGHPPKVIWIRTGNCSTSDIVLLLESLANEILAFEADLSEAFLALT